MHARPGAVVKPVETPITFKEADFSDPGQEVAGMTPATGEQPSKTLPTPTRSTPPRLNRAMKIAFFFIDRPVFAIVLSIRDGGRRPRSRASHCRSHSIRNRARRLSRFLPLIQGECQDGSRNGCHADRNSRSTAGEHDLHVEQSTNDATCC